MNSPYTDRTLALAGLFQAARLTQQLARQGRVEMPAFTASIQSLLLIDAPSTDTVYGGVQGVKLGLSLLRDKFAASIFGQPQADPNRDRGEDEAHERDENKLANKTDAGDVEIAKYVIALILLEGKLRSLMEMQEAIRRGIEAAQAQMKFFEKAENGDAVHPRLIEKLAELYSQTISTLSPRVMVNGEHGHLNNPAIAAKVRATLLAGIRSAFLWRQLGGSRWQLLFNRKKISAEAAKALEMLGTI